MRRRIAEQWDHFAKLIFANRVIGSVQLTETRRAFYAGAIAIFNAVALDMSPGAETVTADDERILEDLAREIKDYERELMDGLRHV